ncbi:MAG: DNA methyltransferase [Methanoregula sp.]|jgi:DNA modification methylase|uniref:DNA methyltransferase n=1 Tax=Methanoregula sp. TaxID=2052170 RepID=UPI003D0BCB68
MAVDLSGINLQRELIDLKNAFPEIPKKNYLTHGFDKYPAKMIPHMAKFLIKKTSKPKQTILDPFCGSGSVVIQSVIEGRSAIGVDLNPLAVLLSQAKATPMNVELLRSQLHQLLIEFSSCKNPYEYSFFNANYWFTPATLRKLGAIKTVLDNNIFCFNTEYSTFWRALFVSIIRECSKADIRGPKPFISKRSQQHRIGKHFDPFKIFFAQGQIWIKYEEEYLLKLKNRKIISNYKILHADSRNLSQILKNEKIDSIITSPPYLNAQDYYRSSKFQLFFLNEICDGEMKKLSRDIIGSDRILQSHFNHNLKLPYPMSERYRLELLDINKKNSVIFSKYILDMKKVIHECNNLLESGSFFSIVIGDNKITNVEIPTHELINEISETEGFHLFSIYSDKIRDRRLPIIRNGHSGIMKNENLLIFKKT